MDSKDKEIAEQQQQRRKRVSRIKTSIIMTIAIWMAISLLAVVPSFLPDELEESSIDVM